ncbi:MAG: histidine kinase, partial [Candidatus Omnitrophica bacterium]|nr:histidine kinase [Candidatus Omnitrophota bacterium]
EIQDLAEGFNTMAGELKELYTNLENKVKERTAQLAEANQTLVFKKDELEKINLKLKELDRMKSDFVANVVHELRTPLTIIKGNIDTIEKGYAGKVLPKQKEILGDVFRVSNRLARLVNDLLDLSKIESGKMKLDIEDVDIIEVAKEATKGFERLASDKKVGLKKEFPSRTVIIKADRDKITQVFINLMGNALKFTDKGDVVVKIIELQDEVQVEVQDTGPGMTKEQVEKIFDKFVRVVAEKKEGTGLGLPIAKDIIELHKGRIRVESEPGKGSTFIFNLPKK